MMINVVIEWCPNMICLKKHGLLFVFCAEWFVSCGDLPKGKAAAKVGRFARETRRVCQFVRVETYKLTVSFLSQPSWYTPVTRYPQQTSATYHDQLLLVVHHHSQFHSRCLTILS